MGCFWIVFIGCRLFHVDSMWIAWIDPINQQTTIRDYLKPGFYETLPTKTNFSRLGI
ncbi:hypothetical protein ACQJ8U_00980 [Helicobacter pylori]